MLSTAHGPTGAFIASKIKSPLISIPLILITHFAQDYIPHWDVGQGLTKKKKNKKDAFLQELLIDFPLSIIVTYFFFQYGQSTFNYRAWMGWFLALLPDFIEFPYLFLGWRFRPLTDFANFHSKMHHSTPKVIKGLIPQVHTLILIYLLK